MAIKLVETAIRPTTIRLRYADADDPAAATEWIDLHFDAKDLKHPKTGNPLGSLGPRYLLEIQAAALHHARTPTHGYAATARPPWLRSPRAGGANDRQAAALTFRQPCRRTVCARAPHRRAGVLDAHMGTRVGAARTTMPA
jgi:hypothetical protein